MFDQLPSGKAYQAAQIFTEYYNENGFHSGMTSEKFLRSLDSAPLAENVSRLNRLLADYSLEEITEAIESLSFWSAYSLPGVSPTFKELELKFKYSVKGEMPYQENDFTRGLDAAAPNVRMVLWIVLGVLILVSVYIATSRVKQLAGT